jgi:hypothetical protein
VRGPGYAYACLQEIFTILSGRYDVLHAVGMIAGEAKLDADFLSLAGVDCDTLSCGLDFDLFDLSELQVSWAPTKFVACGTAPNAAAARALSVSKSRTKRPGK